LVGKSLPSPKFLAALPWFNGQFIIFHKNSPESQRFQYLLIAEVSKRIVVNTVRGGARKSLQPGLNQWASTRWTKIMLNPTALSLNIRVGLHDMNWAGPVLQHAQHRALAPPLYTIVNRTLLFFLSTIK